MERLKYFKQFEKDYYEIDENRDYSRELLMLEGLFVKSEEEEKKKKLDEMLSSINAPTLKDFIKASIENDRLDIDRIIKVLKQLFLSQQGWLKNKNKYALFKELAKEAIEKNTDEAWNKVIGLIDFGMKNGVVATPFWDENKKKWVDKAKPGSVGL